MRVLVCGSRSFYDSEFAFKVLDELLGKHGKFTVVSGTARGADTIGENWAVSRGLKVERFPADWDRYGKGAGFRRNFQMLQTLDPKTDFVLALWDGVSGGTRNTIETAGSMKIAVMIPEKNQ